MHLSLVLFLLCSMQMSARAARRTMARNTITFLGPLTPFSPKTGKPRIKSWGFVVMQGGNDPLTLEYDSEAEAQGARRQLLQGHSTYQVPTNKLLAAIKDALKQVQTSTQSQAEGPANSET
jgi:hypothetical protein